MPIRKQTMVGELEVSSAFADGEISISTTTNSGNTDSFSEESPLRIKGMPVVSFQIENLASSATAIAVTPQAAIRNLDSGGGFELNFYDLSAPVIVGIGASRLLEFRSSVEYIRLAYESVNGGGAQINANIRLAGAE